MADPKINDYLKKRDLLNNPDMPSDEAKKWAESLFEAGMLHDAVDFYKKANDTEGLKRILEIAEDEGDFFLVDFVLKALEDEFDTDRWVKLGKRAEELKKYYFASQAYKKAGMDSEVARLMFLTGERPAESGDLDRDSKHA